MLYCNSHQMALIVKVRKPVFFGCRLETPSLSVLTPRLILMDAFCICLELFYKHIILLPFADSFNFNNFDYLKYFSVQ
jgi:hypothetical protein